MSRHPPLSRIDFDYPFACECCPLGWEKCMYAFFCLPCYLGDIDNLRRGRSLDQCTNSVCGIACAFAAFSHWITPVPSCIFGAVQRQRTRRELNIAGSLCSDCLIYTFCSPCTVIQQERQILQDNYDMPSHPGANFDPLAVPLPARFHRVPSPYAQEGYGHAHNDVPMYAYPGSVPPSQQWVGAYPAQQVIPPQPQMPPGQLVQQEQRPFVHINNIVPSDPLEVQQGYAPAAAPVAAAPVARLPPNNPGFDGAPGGAAPSYGYARLVNDEMDGGESGVAPPSMQQQPAPKYPSLHNSNPYPLYTPQQPQQQQYMAPQPYCHPQQQQQQQQQQYHNNNTSVLERPPAYAPHVAASSAYAPSSSSSVSPFSEQSIHRLQELGCTREQAISALTRSNGDVHRAANAMF